MGEVLVDALRGKGGFFINPPVMQIAARSSIEPNRFLLRLSELVETSRRAQPDLDRVGLKVAGHFCNCIPPGSARCPEWRSMG
jgi:hypothetical protein